MTGEDDSSSYSYKSSKLKKDKQKEDELTDDQRTQLLFKNILRALQKIGIKERNVAVATSFKGTTEEDPIEWLKNFNNVAIANNWNDETKIGVVRTYLQGNALEWFEKNEDNINKWKCKKKKPRVPANAEEEHAEEEAGDINSDDESKNDSTSEFEELFIRKYTTRECKNLWYHQFNTIEQGRDESVSTYTNKFLKLLKKIRLDGNMPDGIITQRYLSGLKGEIAEGVVEQESEDLESLFKTAKQIERGKRYNQSRVISNSFLK